MAFDLGAIGEAYRTKLASQNVDLDPLYKLADLMMKKYELEKRFGKAGRPEKNFGAVEPFLSGLRGIEPRPAAPISAMTTDPSVTGPMISPQGPVIGGPSGGTNWVRPAEPGTLGLDEMGKRIQMASFLPEGTAADVYTNLFSSPELPKTLPFSVKAQNYINLNEVPNLKALYQKMSGAKVPENGLVPREQVAMTFQGFSIPGKEVDLQLKQLEAELKALNLKKKSADVEYEQMILNKGKQLLAETETKKPAGKQPENPYKKDYPDAFYESGEWYVMQGGKKYKIKP